MDNALWGFVEGVKAHARKNYERGGWDFVVECWEDADIAKAIGDANTFRKALANVRKVVRVMHSRRLDVEGEGF